MPKTNKIIQSFNAGELSPLMDARIDQAKYISGCRTLENYIPLIYGGIERRPGTEYIATQKISSAVGKVVPFEHSVDDTYILLFENQVIRVFRNGGQVQTGTGTEDISALNNVVAHWLLNEKAANQTVFDNDDNDHDGSTVTNNTSVLHTAGKTGSGCFNFEGRDAVEFTDAATLSFDDSGTNPFSITSWVFIKDQSQEQVILSKWKGGSAREWKLSLDVNRKLKLSFFDDSTSLSANRVAQWKLNENTTNTTVTDAVGSVPHTGTSTTNTVNLHATGKVGSGCFDFDGQYAVDVGDDAELSFDDSGTNPFSITAWIYVTDTGSYQMILTKYDTSKREWQFYLDPTMSLGFQLIDESAGKGAQILSNAALTVGWHFVAATYDSTGGASASDGLTLYVDGEAVAATASTDTGYIGMENLTKGVCIGARYLSASRQFYFADKIDNPVLYSKELLAAEISSLYAAAEDIDGEYPYRLSNAALTVGWHFVAATYDSTGGASAAGGILLYVDGAVVASTATDDSGYTGMEDTGTKVRIGAQYSGASALEYIWPDRIDNVGLFSDVLTPDEIVALYSTSTYEITTPYLTADLFELKFEYSADVMYITHPDYEPRKLSRNDHDDWTLAVLGLEDGPFRDQNTDTAKTITADATTGNVTLTASGCTPFVIDATSGHSPSGELATSKSQTGALFKLVHAITSDSIDDVLTDNYTNDQTLHTSITSELMVYKGITWDFTTQGTWTGTLKLEREYGNSGVWETVTTVVGVDNKNVTTSGTEEFEDAQYRLKMHASGDAAENCEVQFSVRDSSHIGIVKITSVVSATSATGTVLQTLAATTATHRWSEGSFSNYRGWPIDVTISPEERLTFTGSPSEPLTTWGSVIGDWDSFKEGILDDDAIIHTLIGSGQQNQIQWALTKNALVLGTVGGEHLLGASDDEEALTPTNVKAKLQTTYGSENIAAIIVNQAILFLQRGGRKIREFIYNFEADAHKADDLTVFSNHITESGIVDMAFQRTPDPTLWCVRDDGDMAVMTYERDQDVFSWYRIVTKDGDEFESAAIIYGGANSEDEVWVTVKRVIDGDTETTVRYVERFYQRAMPSALADMKYLDSFITDTGGTVTVSGLDHLNGEEVQVLGDGVVQTEGTAGDFTVSSGDITVPSGLTTVQAGLGYTSTLKPMKLDIAGLGLATTKKISRAIINLYNTIGGEMGTTTSNVKDIPTGTSELFEGEKELSMPGGYSRTGDIIVRQTEPLPMTVLSLTLDVGVAND